MATGNKELVRKKGERVSDRQRREGESARIIIVSFIFIISQ